MDLNQKPENALLSSNKSLNIEDGPFGVDSCLILGSLPNESLTVGEGNPRWSNTVTLVIGYDFNMAILINTNT